MRNVCTAFAVSLLLAAGASAATFTVTNTNDSGPGSLRQAITDANPSISATVAFSIGSGVQTIMPLTALPDVNSGVTIDGTTQPGYAGTPLIELNDSLIASTFYADCLASRGRIKALAINRCTGRGLRVYGGFVTACFIGTDVTGHIARANSTGVLINGLAVLGGNSDAEGNLISGNLRDVTVTGSANGSAISYNKIGTDATGEAALDFNGSAAISVEYTADISVYHNVIGAHSVGIECFYSDRTLISNNYIGVSASGTPLPNSLGIHVYQSNFTEIGMNGGNVIARNTNGGIEMDGASIRNPVRFNWIHHNGTIGIDLSNSYSIDGVTPNDSDDADSGPNLLQNFPVLTSASSVGGQTTITGTITTNPNQLISIDFYDSGQCSSSGNGEGEIGLGSASVQTNGSGNGTFTVTFPVDLVSGSVVTATATDPYGNTSEFSACRAVDGAGAFVLGGQETDISESSSSVTLLVLRTNGTSVPASVNYATANGTATAGSDYTATTGTLSFAAGESSRTLSVPITNDQIYEGNETFTVSLSGPTNGTSIGTQSSQRVTIVDDEQPPSLSIADASLTEGNSGTSNMAFTVTRTGATTAPATVQYSTSSNYAQSGVDFQQVTGTVTFNLGETQKTINVPIIGDTIGESDETFFVYIYNATNAFVTRSSAVGTIINDDPIATVTASDVTIAEGNNGTTNAVITFTASQPFYGEIDYFTLDGTARNGSDYASRSGYIFFNSETTKTITIPITGDTSVEPDETFRVQLSIYNYSSTAFMLPRSSVTVTIVNDDAGIGPTRLSIPTGGKLPLTVNLGSATPQQVTFTSSNPSVAAVPASVQANGVTLVDVTAGHTGDATITATLPPALGNLTQTIEVYVYDAVNLVLAPAAVHVPLGGTATISASFNPALSAAESASLNAAGLGQITLPNGVTVNPGQTATFTIKGIKRGHVILTATLGPVRGSVATSIDVDVEDPPTTPAITQVSPSNGSVAGGTAVTIAGANLRSECTIRFGGVPAANVSFVSATSMTATTPAHVSGAVDVSLACGSEAFTFAGGFTYLAASATLSSVTPSFGATGGNTLVKITGTNIASGCWPFFDGMPARAAMVNGPTEVIASTPAHAVAATVPVILRCTGADASLADAFTYSSAEESSPVITSVDPLVGSPGKSVTISGARFRLDDAVTFDAVAATVLNTTAGTHVVRIPDLPLGKTSITVTDVRGRSSTTGPIFSIVEPQPPQITSATPATTRPSNEVTLDGSGFRPGYTFMIGDQPAPVVTMTYARVVLRVPQLNAGSYAINVMNAASSVAAIGPQLTVLGAGLAVTRVSPGCATTDGHGRITITGSGFAPGAVVTFDGVSAPGAVVSDAQTITLTLPSLPVGTPRVVVTNPNGDSAPLTNGFSVTSPFDPNGCTPRVRPARH